MRLLWAGSGHVGGVRSRGVSLGGLTVVEAAVAERPDDPSSSHTGALELSEGQQPLDHTPGTYIQYIHRSNPDKTSLRPNNGCSPGPVPVPVQDLVSCLLKLTQVRQQGPDVVQ